ncbi:MAG: VCBS repeat-containing protein [Flavitalea sp.]
MKRLSYHVLTFIGILVFAGCGKENHLLRLLSPSESGISFSNEFIENDSINPIDVTNIYNGGGVGIGDFNNDGLQDIYFTASMVSNKLYLNKGNLEFTDVTERAKVTGEGRWCRGVSVIDINNDGLLDIYVATAMHKEPERRMNLLYVNQGVKDGVPLFLERAEEYGLADTSHTTMAAFFDYDNDGDLDVYLAVNQILPGVNPSIFKQKITDGSFPGTGRLLRNEMNISLKHPVFTDVSKDAGVLIEGYSHGVNVSDINRDGWKDILVTNDFIANDVWYINNHDGTFTDRAKTYFKHTSANSMGQDVIDINNDGLSDVVVLDMNPEDNYRKKMMMNSGSYQTFQLNDFFKYQYQYVRNTLQLNQGSAIAGKDSIADPVFSETGFYSGIAETDWSWSPVVADFNNDGLRDLIVTNGFPKDITDHDFISYRKEASQLATQNSTLSQIPQVKLHNYGFVNTGDARFKDVSKEWGLETVSFSNGAAYADLDNDGDLDLVINNINDAAHVYENTSALPGKGGSNYLSVKLKGDPYNINGLGTFIELYYKNKIQVYEQTPYRGYLSTIQPDAHFGLDSTDKIDSLIVKWPNGKRQKLFNVGVNQLLAVDIANAKENYIWEGRKETVNTLFNEISSETGITYEHKQTDLIDFNIQKLLPHKFSEFGPSLAAGDVNGDGLDDLIAGGNSNFPTTMLLQTSSGKFTERTLDQPSEIVGKQYQVMGTILFDANGDGYPDLYLAHGGYEASPGNTIYRDRFYINDGKGNFREDTTAFPVNLLSKSCVRAVDYDNDGDLDLFVAGRVDPWNYPKPVSSFIYRNDSKDKIIKFTDVTAEVAKDLDNIGLVCDALFTDFDNDGWTDLLIAGEWMAPTFLHNQKGVFKNITEQTGIGNEKGWWTSITGGDFDNDGDIDYVVGNLGLNSYMRTGVNEPVSVYAKDFDNNGSYDAFLTQYLPVSQDTLARREFPVALRDDAISQMTVMKSRFRNYKSYASSGIKQLFPAEQFKGALVLKANNFQSVYIKNGGNNKFSIAPLPYQAQLSALNGILAEDFDGDGNLDLLINTNDYGTDVSVGRYDALNGLVLKGDGKGNFAALMINKSGIYIPGNGKSLVKFKTANKSYLVAAAQNRGPLKIFRPVITPKLITLSDSDRSAVLTLKDGRKQKHESYNGSSFLSQSARFLNIGSAVVGASVTDNKGVQRLIKF